MFADEKDEKDEVGGAAEEIEDLDTPGQEGDDVVGGRPPKIIVPTKTAGCVAG